MFNLQSRIEEILKKYPNANLESEAARQVIAKDISDDLDQLGSEVLRRLENLESPSTGEGGQP